MWSWESAATAGPLKIWSLMGPIQKSSKSGWVHCKTSLDNFWVALETQRSPSWLEADEVFPVFRQDKEDNSSNYRPICLTSMPGKFMEKIFLWCFDKNLEDNAVTCHSQHGFMRGKSGLSNLISFHDKVTHLGDQREPFDVIFLDFSKAFDNVSPSILLDKMWSWVSSWLTG